MCVLVCVHACACLCVPQAFSTPWFLFASPTNHHLVFFLLEVFNNIIQYQFDGESGLAPNCWALSPFEHRPKIPNCWALSPFEHRPKIPNRWALSPFEHRTKIPKWLISVFKINFTSQNSARNWDHLRWCKSQSECLEFLRVLGVFCWHLVLFFFSEDSNTHTHSHMHTHTLQIHTHITSTHTHQIHALLVMDW